MEGIGAAVANVIAAIPKHEVVGADDWVDIDGLRVCGVCGEPKEVRVTILGTESVMPCMCKCESDAYNAKQARWKAEQKRIRIQNLRTSGIQDVGLRSCRFEDAIMNPQMERCKYYAEHFEEFKKKNIGLLFCGPVGNGKTFAAACIANYLIDHYVPVLVTSLPRILNTPMNEINSLIRECQEYELLVVDDFGIERQTEYAQETAQYFFDERYKSGLPTIVTTNVSKKDLENPRDMRNSRLFSRIIEMCLPMQFPKTNWRENKAAEKKAAASELVRMLTESEP